MWTVSEAKAINRCQRQWFYQYRFRSALATKAPARREAYVLSTFQTVDQWRGSVVDMAIKEIVVPALNNRQELWLKDLLRQADRLFDSQLAYARANRARDAGMAKSHSPTEFAALLVVEENGDISDEDVQRARADVHAALLNLAKIPGLRDTLRSARRVVAQNTYHFKYRDEPMKVVPDLVVFYQDRPPLVIDWKVHFFGLRDARTQLLIYAMGLARSGKAGGTMTRSWLETEIATMEVQLLTGVTRTFTLDDAAVVEMEEFIDSSMRTIARVGEGKEWDEIDVTDLSGPLADDGCENCGFKPLCWK